MNTKRFTPMLLALTAGSVVLAGCGADGVKTGAKTEQPAAANKETAPAELVFHSANGDTEESFNERFGSAIRKKFPQHTIKYIQRVSKTTELENLMTTGTKIDIYFDSIPTFEPKLTEFNLQYDISELVKKHKVDLSRFEQTSLDGVRRDGKMYGLPVFNNSMVLYYNKSIFDKFGVPYPKDGMTWDELAELSKKLTRNDGGKEYYGFMTSASHIIRMNPLSTPNVDLKTEQPTIHTNEKWKQLFQTVFLNPSQGPSFKTKFKETKKAQLKEGLDSFMVDQSLAMYAYIATFPFVEKGLANVNWDMVSLPTFKEMPGVGSQSYPSYFGITSQSQNVDAAMEVLKFLTSDDMQLELSKKGIMPAIASSNAKSVFGSESIIKDKNLKAIFHNKYAPIPPKALYDSNVINVYVNQVIPLQAGNADINSAFRTAEEGAQKVIRDYKSK